LKPITATRPASLDAPLPLANPRAAVVFDGLSLRELPLLLKMAEDSGFRVKSTRAVATCLPTETIHFVDERVMEVLVPWIEL
jgi:hypothetical protein